MTLTQAKLNSPLGMLYLVASKKGLQGVYFEKQPVPLALRPEGILSQACRELIEYFEGKRKDFEVPLDLVGTPFQKRVWEALTRIPYGKTFSYKQLARQVRNPKAMRAVGGANGKNPVCIIVPCHRVIAADGTLGGYSAGLERKRKLLRLEQVSFKEKRNAAKVGTTLAALSERS